MVVPEALDMAKHEDSSRGAANNRRAVGMTPSILRKLPCHWPPRSRLDDSHLSSLIRRCRFGKIDEMLEALTRFLEPWPENCVLIVPGPDKQTVIQRTFHNRF